MTRDIPVSRAVIEQLDTWLAELAGSLLPLRRVAEKDGDFHWSFTSETPYALQIGKSVRMISGLRGALLLCDAGHTVECASLLRIVSDFAQEIIAVSEGLVEGRLTEPQERFVRQYFAPLAQSPNEFENKDKERYVTREELMKAHYRLAAKTTGEGEHFRKVSRFLNYSYDKYVHGAYLTAMELFTGNGNRFMLRGHESALHRCVSRTTIAGKLHEVVIALEFMSAIAGNERLSLEIRSARKALETSQEQSESR